jgi:hypothetical protein
MKAEKMDMSKMKGMDKNPNNSIKKQEHYLTLI